MLGIDLGLSAPERPPIDPLLRQRAAELAEELAQDPQKLARWVGYGDRLLEEP